MENALVPSFGKGMVFIKNGKVYTDSLMIAANFGKEHRDVLKSIKTLECSKEFNERNFALTSYTDKSNRQKPKYDITHDGYTFLVMGYKGKKAARLKEAHITVFNRMEAYIRADLDKRYLAANRQALLGAVSTGNMIAAKMRTSDITEQQLANYYFYRQNWLSKKEITKAFGFSASKMRVMDEVLEREGHEMPHVNMNKRDKALTDLHFTRTAKALTSHPSFSHFQ